MKTYSNSPLAFLCLILLAFGCKKKENNPITPSSNITYSNSPFDLQGINAKFAKDIAEKLKIKLPPHAIKDARGCGDFIAKHNLLDVDLHGNKYTWNNRRLGKDLI